MATMPEGELQFEIGEIKPQKWEYFTSYLGRWLDNPKRNTETLDKLGKIGWELVSFNNDGIYHFKRPIWSD